MPQLDFFKDSLAVVITCDLRINERTRCSEVMICARSVGGNVLASTMLKCDVAGSSELLPQTLHVLALNWLYGDPIKALQSASAFFRNEKKALKSRTRFGD